MFIQKINNKSIDSNNKIIYYNGITCNIAASEIDKRMEEKLCVPSVFPAK